MAALNSKLNNESSNTLKKRFFKDLIKIYQKREVHYANSFFDQMKPSANR